MDIIKQSKGITLTAIVIVVIVLIILAGVTINLTVKEDGIMKKAQEAGENYTNAAAYEKTSMDLLLKYVDDVTENIYKTDDEITVVSE